MNPLTNAFNQQKLSEKELELGVSNTKSSWHSLHKNSAYIYAGGLPYELSEGDIICVFSQYGEIVDVNLIRDKASGKSKGFCFLAYEDQRSTVLAVDNLNTARICNRQIRVQHVADYKAAELKERDLKDADKKDWIKLQVEGVAPKAPKVESSDDGHENEEMNKKAAKKLAKKERKEKKKEKKLMKKKQKLMEEIARNDFKNESERSEARKPEMKIKRERSLSRDDLERKKTKIEKEERIEIKKEQRRSPSDDKQFSRSSQKLKQRRSRSRSNSHEKYRKRKRSRNR